jgi:hypothetical protein
MIEQTAARIAKLLIVFGKLPNVRVDINLGRALGVPSHEIPPVMMWLRRRVYIYVDRAYIYLTTEGRNWLHGLDPRADTTKPGQVQEFRNEVLTGMTEGQGKAGKVSEQTEIQNPVLPKPKGKKDSYADFQHDMSLPAAGEVIRRLVSRETGASRGQVEQWATEGRVRPCRGWMRDQHIGVFDRNGDGFRSLCRACEKEKRCR